MGILKHRKSSSDKKNVKKIMNHYVGNSMQSHLANRISDIQNKRGGDISDVDSAASSRPSTITEIECIDTVDFDQVLNKQISATQKNTKYGILRTFLYLLLYIINASHLLSSIWFLWNVYTRYHTIDRIANYIQILFYFNVSILVLLELWKLFAFTIFAAIILNIESVCCQKLNDWQLWRLQFWIFLPFVWLIHKSSFHLFLTLHPIPIQIWFDFCAHHIWMLLLWILYILYPYIQDDTQLIQDYLNMLSSIIYISTLCLIFIVTFCIKMRCTVSSQT